MYKHLAARVTKRISPHGISTMPKQIIIQRSMRLCSFCNFYHGKISKYIKHYQICTYATTVNILGHIPIKKKVKQKTKKYAELLAVTNKTASNKRTEVQKLSVCNLSMYIDKCDINTNNSYDVKDSIHNQPVDSKYTNEDYICDNKIYLNIDNHIDEITRNEMEDKKKTNFNNWDNCNEINDNLLQNSSTFPFVKTINSKEKQKLNNILKSNINNTLPQKKIGSHETKNKYGLENYVTNLIAYMEVYLNCGLLSRANNTLMKYRKYTQNTLKCDKGIELYNILLEAYAFRRKIMKVLELYDIIKKDSLIPTPQTYAYIFDAFGRESINKKQIELLKTLNAEMKNYNISFNDIFNKSCFKNDQQENILKVISMLTPNFQPSYAILNTEYSCYLLKNISLKNNYESPVEELLTMKELKDCFKMQFQNELSIDVQIPSIIPNEENIETNSEKKIIEIENCWKNVALAAFERNLKCLKQKECRHNTLMVLYPFLEVLDKEVYVNAILQEIRQIVAGSETYSTSLKLLYITLGKFIYRKYEMEIKKRTGLLDKITRIYSKYLEWYLHPKNIECLSNTNNRTIWQYFEYKEAKYGTSLNLICLNWPMDVIINIGKFLYNIILNDIMLQPEILKGQDIKNSIPAFYTLFRNKGNYLSEQIKPHPFVTKLYKKIHLKTLNFDSVLLPSYAPPTPWISIYRGGYLITKTDFTRISNNSDSSCHYLQSTETEQLFPIFDSLNQLGSIPWKVNTVILDIVIKIFQNGGSTELGIPQSVSVLSPPCSISKNATVEEKQKAAIAAAQYRKKKFDMYSSWCDTLYKLSIANHLRNKIFWLPHNVDFRGRTYPLSPYLNHLSSDLGRSLLLFAKGKPLGPNGLKWLKLHVINLTNFKKGTSVNSRLEYADQNMENIIDSGTKPLTGKMWWTQSEEPWQTLAGCIEITNALKAPNIEKYITTFPVHQDGSCNGLQHYAALGKDQIGAESVNLYPFDVPKDVYSAVVSIIEEQRQMDAKNNVKIAQILEGFIKRKVIKQTVMTTVYGVTKYGAKYQIAKQLKDMDNFPEEYVWPASIYLTENTFHSLRKMFQSARQIQDWFITCAQIISSVCGENVEWITPLGFPVIQPYVKLQKISTNYICRKPDAVKQRNAFAPNFIHSLDSTHMMLTGLYCTRKNVTFVSVHDCFWTHPSTIDIMNKICREQFVALHSEPILENLAKFFMKRYSPIYLKLNSKNCAVEKIHESLNRVPQKGTFDINHVLSSTYFFN
ncbi:PREDICTED: DNA-directed RNA polymerase, mitochondrial [Eufriesea mexicana]|uniref:DNA-directed RNA polymerase, mitochondrial n=1 Tax=Eufriesea mexicana TaxID=516756 RepID=UPI00083C6CDC|nr:PREDICTED: DNA-directed RNA polymerase, mitochondrial [Eufriesea mexicana]